MALISGFVDFFLTFIAVLLAISYFTRKKRDPRYPPGPPALPIIGNLLQFGTEPQETLMKWAKEYGPVFSFKRGSDDVIMINDVKLVKDVFQEHSSTGRSPHPIFLEFGQGNHGVIMAEGAHWEQQRRFTLRKLRDFGFAKSAMEDKIAEEVTSMMNWLDKRVDKSIDGHRIFNGPVVNALWGIISGERTDWDSPNKPLMMKQAERMMAALHKMGSTGVLVLPFLRHIVPSYSGWNDWVNNIHDMVEAGGETVRRHAKELDPNNPQDLIDHFLIEQQNTTDPTSSFYKETGDKNLSTLIPDLFIAGSETTSHTTSWTLLLMSYNPDVQKKLQKELDTVLGKDRMVSLSDRPNLPYAEAVVLETLRRTSVTANGVPHRMIEDAVISGYFFPKNTDVISNTFYIHNDPKVWGDPETYRPERFLSPDGKKVIKHDAFMPFSLGKRQCLGMSLALDTLFLFTATIFQKFNIKPDPNDHGNAINRIKPTMKILNEPEPFKVIVSRRQ